MSNWIYKYNSGSLESLSKKLKNNKFTSEFKLSVIQYRQINNTSLRETAERFNLVNGSMIYRWEKAYRKGGLSGLEDKRRRPKKDMTKSNKKSKHNPKYIKKRKLYRQFSNGELLWNIKTRNVLWRGF